MRRTLARRRRRGLRRRPRGARAVAAPCCRATRCRAHAGGVRGVPARPRRFPRSRDARRRSWARVQRHELRRLPQRARDRRRQHDRRAARRAPPTPTASSSRSMRRAKRSSSLFSVPDARLPGDDSGRGDRHRAPHPDSAVRRRARRGDRGRDNPRRSRIPSDRNRDGDQRPRGAHHRHRDRRAGASDGSAGRRSTRRCSPSAPTPIATRWASRTISSRPNWRPASTPRGCGCATAFPIPEDIRDPRTRRRGIDNFASFMRFLAPVARAGGDAAVRADGRAGVRRHRLRGVPRAGADHRSQRQPALRPPAGGALLGPVAARRRHRRRHPAGRGRARRDSHAALWGLRFRRPLLHDGSAATIDEAIRRHGGEAGLAREGYGRMTEADRAALLAFLGSL